MEHTHNTRGPFTVRYPCEAYLNDHLKNRTYRCDLRSGHLGSHSDSTGQQVWPLTTPREYAHWFQQEYKTGVLGDWQEKTTVLLTLEDLKGLSYALSGPEWLEDEPELVAKIDNALKGML